MKSFVSVVYVAARKRLLLSPMENYLVVSYLMVMVLMMLLFNITVLVFIIQVIQMGVTTVEQ